jgi:1,4-dihydroxy-2-naphthoyl-CoA hydrolase
LCVLPEQASEQLERYAGIDPAVADQQLNEKVGMKLVEITPERVVGTIPVEGNLQPYGLLHGGANAVLAEALGSTVAALNAGPDRVAMGLELSCTHHRAVRTGLVTGVATPLHVGRGTVTVDIAISDDEGRRSCSARLTCVIRDAPPAR